jgi:hypothetical protein
VSTQPPSAAPVEYHNREQQQNGVNRNPQNSLSDSQERLEAASINSIRGPARTTPSPNYQNAGNPSNLPTDQNADRRGQNRPNNGFAQNTINFWALVPSQNGEDQRVAVQNFNIPLNGNPQHYNPQSSQSFSNRESTVRNLNYSHSKTQKPFRSEEQTSGFNPSKPPKRNQQTSRIKNSLPNPSNESSGVKYPL